MIKELKKFQIRTTPFQATKDWQLNNIVNDGVILLEQTASDGSDIAMALEFVDYGDGSSDPVTGSTCDVAMEQQEPDKVGFREGLKLSGIFYPDADPKNADGTFKRVVYSQTSTMFYNLFRNPTEILGIETLDFETSKTKRRITNQLKLFSIPQKVYGDKIIPGSVFINDFSQDNDYVIADDGFENLVVGNNLFSKVQQIGKFGNAFAEGVDGTCDSYFNFTPVTSSPSPPSGSTTLSVTSGSAVLSWTTSISSTETYWDIDRSLNGVTFGNFATASQGVHTYTDTLVTSSALGTTYWYKVAAVNNVGTSSFSNTASITFIFPLPAAAPVLTGQISIGMSGFESDLSWSYSLSDETGFVLQRSTDGGATWPISILLPSSSMYADSASIVTDVTFTYQIAATNAAGSGAFSNLVSLITSSAAPLPSFCLPSPFQGSLLSGSTTIPITI